MFVCVLAHVFPQSSHKGVEGFLPLEFIAKAGLRVGAGDSLTLGSCLTLGAKHVPLSSLLLVPVLLWIYHTTRVQPTCRPSRKRRGEPDTHPECQPASYGLCSTGRRRTWVLAMPCAARALCWLHVVKRSGLCVIGGRHGTCLLNLSGFPTS